MQPDELFMRRAIELAERGAGTVSPNPMVGCVVVRDSVVVGEGWHQQFGGPHAEVNALGSVRDKSSVPGSTVYVSLEPCSHFGKTPPCSDLLIQQKVERVIIGCLDPNPVVNGSGIKKLKEAGIHVEISSLKNEAFELNKRFFTAQIKKRPFVILKWAQTSDRLIARVDHSSKWISSELSRQLVHRWRAEEDAILIGRNTAEKDNPLLTVRDWIGRNPLRVLIMKNGAIDPGWNIFNSTAPTLCYSSGPESSTKEIEVIKIKENFLPSLLSDLHSRGIISLIVEGGAATLKSFIDAGLWDEARVFTAPISFEKGIHTPELNGIKISESASGPDTLTIYRHPDSLFNN